MSNQQEFEEKFKNELYDKIGEMISSQSEAISSIQSVGKPFNLGDDLNNIGITMNNKIVELKNEFERAGISIYSQKIENYRVPNTDFTTSSFIGKAIIFDLMDYANKGMEQLGKYSEAMEQILDEKTQKSKALTTASPVKKFFAKIRSFFKPSEVKPWELTQEEAERLETYLSNYREIGNKLFGYNLRDNIVSSIVKEIRGQRFSAFNVPGLLEESVIPDLEKLGLADLIPSLEEALVEEYKKYLPDIEGFRIKEENMHLYVPDFNRNRQNSEKQGEDDLHSRGKKGEPLQISILDKTETQDFEQLRFLIKKFTIDTYIRNKPEFAELRGNKKLELVNKAISEFEGQAESSVLSNEDMEQLKRDIDSQISLAKESIDRGKSEDSETRYYVLKDEGRMVSFQQAQLVKEKNTTRVEGWRNLAYVEQEYAGKTGEVIDSNGNLHTDVYSEVLYGDIGEWFEENGVNYERTCTGVNMLANIATYMRIKGFLPFDKDDKRIFLEKFAEHKLDAAILTKAYNLYRVNRQRTEHIDKTKIEEEIQGIAEFDGLTESQKTGLIRCFLKEDEKEFEIPEGKIELFNELVSKLRAIKTEAQGEISQDDLARVQEQYGLTDKQFGDILKKLEKSEQNSSVSKAEERPTKSTQDLGRETLTEQKDTAELDRIERTLGTQEKAIDSQKDSQENPQTL